MIRAVFISSLILNAGLLLGRFSGFARDAVLASSFGVTAEADVAVLMLSIPDLLVNILVGGGLAAALIPEFTDDSHHSRLVWFQSCFAVMMFFSVITMVLIINVEWFIWLIAPGFTAYQVSLGQDGLVVVLWLIPLTVMAGVMTAYLQAYNRFIAVSLGTLIINIVIISGLLVILIFGGSLLWLGFFVLIGGAVRLLMQFYAGTQLFGMPLCSVKPWLIDKGLFKRYLQVAGAGSLLLCFPVIVRAFASSLGEGSVAEISYAIKLVELPLVLTVTFLSVVFFPRMARAYGVDNQLFTGLVFWGLRLTLFLALVATVSINSIAPSLVQLVYGYGNMTLDALNVVTQLFQLGVLGLVFMGVSGFVTAVFNAQKDTRTPLLINVIALCVLITLLVLEGAGSMIGVMASLVIAYATSGGLSILMIIIRFKDICSELFSPGYWLVIILIPLGLYYIIPILLSEVSGAFKELLAVFSMAAICCILAASFVPAVRQKVLRK